MTPILMAVIVLALVFDFLNGVHDSSNIVATMISSRAFSPRVALGTTAVAEFSGPFIFGVAVANTIGHEIVDPETISIEIILAALAERHPLGPADLVPGLSQQLLARPDRWHHWRGRRSAPAGRTLRCRAWRRS